MQDKIVKLLNLKIEDIKQNIDNLNYLNDELNKNQDNLDYVSSNIEIFDNDILNFDNISKEDFTKLLDMLGNDIALVFEDKSCNYQGILYIIDGIRQGISLFLTKNQEDAINKFLDGLKNLQDSLNNKILNLEENKSRLPETDLTILETDLVEYEEVVNNLNNNKYLTEIEKILEVVEFNNTTIEEKIEIFAYLLKYNRDIYENSIKQEEVEINEEYINLPEIDVTSLAYEPVNEENVSAQENFNHDIDKTEATSFNIEDIIQKIDMKLKEIESANSETKEENEEVPFNNLEEVISDKSSDMNLDELETISFEELSEQEKDDEIENTLIDIPTFDEFNYYEQNNQVLDDHLVNEIETEVKETVDNLENTDVLTELNEDIEKENNLEDISLKLEENEQEISVEENNLNQDINLENKLNELYEKYNLTLPLEGINNIEKTDKLLDFLKQNNLLDKLKEDNNILNILLKNNNIDNLTALLDLIKKEFALNEKNIDEILSIFIDTLPILFTNSNMLNVFANNIAFFKQHQINLINLFDNYRELFIVDTLFLENNKKKIESYKLVLDNDNVKYLLCNKKILENLDYYIEANGHEKGFLGKEAVFNGIEYIKKHPYKLNSISRNTLMRLRYSSENNLKIYGNKPGILAGEIANEKVNLLNISDEYKNLYFNFEYEFIDRSDLLDLMDRLNNINEFDLSVDEIILKLDNLYMVDDLRYKINDLYFSRNKTIRLYNYLKNNNLGLKETLIIALTYNSVIKKDEYLNLENKVTSLIGEGVNN